VEGAECRFSNINTPEQTKLALLWKLFLTNGLEARNPEAPTSQASDHLTIIPFKVPLPASVDSSHLAGLTFSTAVRRIWKSHD